MRNRLAKTGNFSKCPDDKYPEAVALRYDPQVASAPIISASGRGEVAKWIIALAEENGVSIRHDPDLVMLLAQLDVGQIIPPELYVIVAEVLAFVYQLQLNKPSKNA